MAWNNKLSRKRNKTLKLKSYPVDNMGWALYYSEVSENLQLSFWHLLLAAMKGELTHAPNDSTFP